MANKEDLRRRNRELRHNQIVKGQEAARKEAEKALKEKEKAEAEANKPEKNFPDLILTMRKRLARIDPWNGVASMDAKQGVMITYYKLRQIGMEKIRIVANSAHAWCEFEYDDKWWILDLASLRKKHLGQPLIKKSEAEAPEYTTMSRSYKSIDDYLEEYGKDTYLDKDDCKILAMKDAGMHCISRLNYF